MEKQMSSGTRLKMPSSVSKDIMESIIKSIYTGIFSLNPTNFEKIFQTAKLLKMHLLITAMEIRLKQMMSLKKNMTKNTAPSSSSSSVTIPNAVVIPLQNNTPAKNSKFLSKSKPVDRNNTLNNKSDQNDPSLPPEQQGSNVMSRLHDDTTSNMHTDDRKLSNCDVKGPTTNSKAIAFNPYPTNVMNPRSEAGNKVVRFSDKPEIPSTTAMTTTKVIKEIRPAKKKKATAAEDTNGVPAKSPRNSIYTTEPVKKLTSSDVFRKYRY